MTRIPTLLRFVCLLFMLVPAGGALAAEPLKIGFSLALSGALAPGGRQILDAIELWRDDVNARGGLLGRPVALDFYDDQSNPANVPAIYTKIIEIDKADLVVGPYGTPLVAPAIPVVMRHNMVTIGILALAANDHFHYAKFFDMLPVGQTPKRALSAGFFALAAGTTPRPRTLAIVAADSEFSKNTADGARQNAQAAGFDIVYDKSYPASLGDFAPILRAVKAAGPDILYVAAYPPDTVGIVRAAREIGVTPKIFGGNMIGLTITPLKIQLGPLVNGIVNTDIFVPAPSFDFPGVAEVLKRYQARAAREGLDPLGYGFVPFGYAAMQVLGEAVVQTNSLDADKIAAYIGAHRFTTTAGEIEFGRNGEWKQSRIITTQFQHVSGHAVEEFKDMTKHVILWPPALKSGDLLYPYAAARK
ncbi:MAG TPA: amino acid ABC transporter substrate-binding protein [Stellaceae bacterium]|nr:amino acid ABC transporter substrate-binding protein [Stellaceae bacterium]